ncbi:MAG TPA: glycosyltransferase [Candidatus Omnitrophota bacterium]|nr:glycosyltransferase [Candidatus Omnitrophota bacterium]
MSRALQIGIFDDHELGGCIIFEKGLKRNGFEVDRFDYRKIAAEKGVEAMNREAIGSSLGHDLVFIGKGELLEPRTLAKMRGKGITTALWYGDIREKPEPWLIGILPEIDFFFMSSAGETLKQHFVEGRPRNAAFYFNPSDPELAEKYSVYPRGTKNLVLTASDNPYASKERIELIRYISERKDAKIFGGAEALVKRPGLAKRLWNRLNKTKSARIRGADYVKAIKSARIGVGVNAYPGIEMYTSDRMSHYLTFGTFYMPWAFPGLEKLFRIGEEVVAFSNVEDLDVKVRYFLADAEARETIARNGQRRMLEDYNTANMVGMMLDIMDKGRSDRYEWGTVLK